MTRQNRKPLKTAKNRLKRALVIFFTVVTICFTFALSASANTYYIGMENQAQRTPWGFDEIVMGASEGAATSTSRTSSNILHETQSIWSIGVDETIDNPYQLQNYIRNALGERYIEEGSSINRFIDPYDRERWSIITSHSFVSTGDMYWNLEDWFTLHSQYICLTSDNFNDLRQSVLRISSNTWYGANADNTTATLSYRVLKSDQLITNGTVVTPTITDGVYMEDVFFPTSYENGTLTFDFGIAFQSIFDSDDPTMDLYDGALLLYDITLTVETSGDYQMVQGGEALYFSFHEFTDSEHASDLQLLTKMYFNPVDRKSIDFNDVNMIQWLVDLVNSVFEIRLIGIIRIGDLIWFAFGLAALTLFIKLYLGG